MSAMPEQSMNPDRDLSRTYRAVSGGAVIGLIGVSLYAFAGHWDDFGVAVTVLGIALLIAGASFLLGAVIGFLFGIPRTLQQGRGSEDAAKNQSNPTAPVYQVNTNLEQISDWLTKILVGVGLTQLQAAPASLGRVAGTLGAGLGPGEASRVVAAAVILHFAACGFFFGYLLTRLFLTGAFYRAEHAQTVAQNVAQLVTQDLRETQQTAFEGFEFRVSANLIETQMFDALYQDPPVGFQHAIELFERYRRQDPDPKNPSLWVYLACAYGQNYAWEQAHENRPEVLQPAREQALNAVRKALELDPSKKELLASFLTAKPGEVDNDLAAFKEDQEFVQLLK